MNDVNQERQHFNIGETSRLHRVSLASWLEEEVKRIVNVIRQEDELKPEHRPIGITLPWERRDEWPQHTWRSLIHELIKSSIRISTEYMKLSDKDEQYKLRLRFKYILSFIDEIWKQGFSDPSDRITGQIIRAKNAYEGSEFLVAKQACSQIINFKGNIEDNLLLIRVDACIILGQILIINGQIYEAQQIIGRIKDDLNYIKSKSSFSEKSQMNSSTIFPKHQSDTGMTVLFGNIGIKQYICELFLRFGILLNAFGQEELAYYYFKSNIITLLKNYSHSSILSNVSKVWCRFLVSKIKNNQDLLRNQRELNSIYSALMLHKNEAKALDALMHICYWRSGILNRIGDFEAALESNYISENICNELNQLIQTREVESFCSGFIGHLKGKRSDILLKLGKLNQANDEAYSSLRLIAESEIYNTDSDLINEIIDIICAIKRKENNLMSPYSLNLTLKKYANNLRRLFYNRANLKSKILRYELFEFLRGFDDKPLLYDDSQEFFQRLEALRNGDALHDMRLKGMLQTIDGNISFLDELERYRKEIDKKIDDLESASRKLEFPGSGSTRSEQEQTKQDYDKKQQELDKLREGELRLMVKMAEMQGLSNLLPVSLDQALQVFPFGSAYVSYVLLPEENILLAVLLRHYQEGAEKRDLELSIIENGSYKKFNNDPTSEIFIIRIPCDCAALEKLVQEALEIAGRRAGLSIEDEGKLEDLYDILIRSIEPRLPQLPDAARKGDWLPEAPWKLYISPDGVLYDVPWHALVRRRDIVPPKEHAADAGALLIPVPSRPVCLNDLATVRIIPSVSTLHAMVQQARQGWAAEHFNRDEPVPAPGSPEEIRQLREVLELADRQPISFRSALLVADSLAYVDPEGQGVAEPEQIDVAKLKDLGELTNALDALDYVADGLEKKSGKRWQIPPKKLCNITATLGNILQALREKVEMFVLSVHGEVNSVSAQHGRLYLTPGPPSLAQRLCDRRRSGLDPKAATRGGGEVSGTPIGDDPVLTQMRVLQLARSKQLDFAQAGLREMIADGCNSAVVGSSGGDIKGHVAAWTAAGVSSLLAGLFMLQDKETAELTKRYFDFLAKELPPTAALRAAMRSMYDGDMAKDELGYSADYPRPYAWAGLQRYGIG